MQHGTAWYRCKDMAMNDDHVAEVAKKVFEESMELSSELLTKTVYITSARPRKFCVEKRVGKNSSGFPTMLSNHKCLENQWVRFFMKLWIVKKIKVILNLQFSI